MTCAAPAVEIVGWSPTPKATRARARAVAPKISADGQPREYLYAWNRCGRKGQRCIVTARGKMNSCRVQFADGFVMVTSRNALRKAGNS